MKLLLKPDAMKLVCGTPQCVALVTLDFDVRGLVWYGGLENLAIESSITR
jgi:hypothetical protein